MPRLHFCYTQIHRPWKNIVQHHPACGLPAILGYESFQVRCPVLGQSGFVRHLRGLNLNRQCDIIFLSRERGEKYCFHHPDVRRYTIHCPAHSAFSFADKYQRWYRFDRFVRLPVLKKEGTAQKTVQPTFQSFVAS